MLLEEKHKSWFPCFPTTNAPTLHLCLFLANYITVRYIIMIGLIDSYTQVTPPLDGTEQSVVCGI